MTRDEMLEVLQDYAKEQLDELHADPQAYIDQNSNMSHVNDEHIDATDITPIYTFETALPVTCQIGYALGKINTTNVVVIGTGKTQLIKVNMGDTVTAEIFYIFTGNDSLHDGITE